METVSVIVCTFNRCESLKKTLMAQRNQKITPAVSPEHIIVDNNSTDNTRKVVEALQKNFPWPLRYVFEPNQGLSHARNRGILESEGDLLAFTDDDVIVDRNWLAALLKATEKYKAVAVGGKVLPLWSQKPAAWMERKSVWGSLSLLDNGEEVIIPQRLDRNLFFGANMAFRRSVFDELGMFRTDLGAVGKKAYRGEETEMLLRMFKAGKRAIYTPDAVVYHKIPLERMSIGYVRRLTYRAGNSVSLFTDSQAKGISRWFVKECFGNGLKAMWAYLQRNKGLAVDHEVAFWFQLGQIAESLKCQPKKVYSWEGHS